MPSKPLFIGDSLWIIHVTSYNHNLVGGWYTYPSEKYISSSVGMIFHVEMIVHSQLNGKSFKIPWFQSPPTLVLILPMFRMMKSEHGGKITVM